MKVHGTIERITYHNAENGFCVLQVNVREHKDLITVVGTSATPTAGEYVDCEGEWVNSCEFGRQFRAQDIKTILPNTLEGIEKYLGSGLLKGIGPHFAKKLVGHFGMEVFEVIEQTPERLMTLPGIGKGRFEQIKHSWKDQKAIREIMIFLQSHGVGTARAIRIYKTYGQSAIQTVTENPYRLAQDIRGIGFKTADQLGAQLGIDRHAGVRAQAGVRHVLQEMAKAGHCAMPTLQLNQRAHELLDIPIEVIQNAVIEELREQRIVLDTVAGEPCIFLSTYHRAEIAIAKHLKRLSEHPLAWADPIDSARAIPWVEEKTKLTLSDSQKDAIQTALSHKVMIITGGPGVGKTTLVNSILKILQSKTQNILLAAPTGRAAKRLAESTGLEAKTLHRLLEFDPKTFSFRKNSETPLVADWVIVDEVSMIDVLMMHHLVKSIPSHAGLLLVGDVDQLPSVSAGAVLANLIDAHAIPTARLTEIFRQASASKIILNAHRINHGKTPQKTEAKTNLSDFYYLPCENPEDILQKLLHVVTERIPKRFHLHAIQDIQVLCPMNKGTLGVRYMNQTLQKLLNPTPSKKITRFGTEFAVGDKVIQTVNNYDKDVFNGDIGFIQDINLDDSVLSIRFDATTVIYEFDELDEVVLAYATTIHKSQGSEYPAVVIPLAMQHYTLLERNLLYTAVTRAKRLLVLLAEPTAMRMAVQNTKAGQRFTNLTHHVQQQFSHTRALEAV